MLGVRLHYPALDKTMSPLAEQQAPKRLKRAAYVLDILRERLLPVRHR
jgi:hypothetical protein